MSVYQWQHIAGMENMGCSQHKDSSKFLSCRWVVEDSLYQLGILVLLIPQLKNMHFESQSSKGSYLYHLRSTQDTWPSPIKGYLQVQISLWSLALHSAPWAQLPGLQRGWHSFLVKPLPGTKSHISVVAQSGLLLQPASMHATRGLPWRPGGQTQMAVWKSTSHWALVPQMVVKQGSTHSWDLQALSKGQSLSTWHSSKKLKLEGWNNWSTFGLLLNLHW